MSMSGMSMDSSSATMTMAMTTGMASSTMASMATSTMDSMSSMSSTDMAMNVVFTNSRSTPLYSTGWTPETSGAYAGTIIFLILLASIFRGLFAAKTLLEHRWLAQARNRRYVVVKGKNTEAGRIEADLDAKTGSLITSQGVEENVKIVRTSAKEVVPFRLSVDIPRAAMVMLITGVGYLLMLAVMTMNIGYFCAVLGGSFLGELAVGRYSSLEEH